LHRCSVVSRCFGQNTVTVTRLAQPARAEEGRG
jgi:hypothetical protein